MIQVYANGRLWKADYLTACGCQYPSHTKTQLRRLARIELLLRADRITFAEALRLRK